MVYQDKCDYCGISGEYETMYEDRQLFVGQACHKCKQFIKADNARVEKL